MWPKAMVVVVAAVSSTCWGGTAPSPSSSSAPAVAAPQTTAPAATSTEVPITVPPPTTTTTTTSPFARPEWLGTRELPLRPDGHGVAQPTPPELRDRRLETVDLLPPPDGEQFEWSIGSVPAEVLARSSWSAECPVTVEELAYLTVTHVGFDGEFHTGELLVNVAVAEDVVEVFRRLHEAGFPIEQMRVIREEEIDAPPTGDWNDTTSFVCRPAIGSESWSQHAYGLAVDVSPFHNPYVKGDLVLPELASAYTDRSHIRTGMILPGDVVTQAFADIGWGWGGHWNSLKDWMHFSLSGR